MDRTWAGTGTGRGTAHETMRGSETPETDE